MSQVPTVVVGGGATGLGVALDLATRGLRAVVVERGRIGQGTSGRFHGLAHSGGRYAVTDPVAAAECAAELDLLRTIAPGALEPTGGWFVRTNDDERFEQAWLEGASRAGIVVREVPLAEARAIAPTAAKQARRIWWVPDGVLEGFVLLRGLVRALRQLGGEVLEGTEVIGLLTAGGLVRGVRVRLGAEERELEAQAVVNAAGPLAGEVGRRLGVEVPVRPSYGTMLIFADRRLPLVVNHLEPPGDGDIFVPHGHTVILGTTDVPTDNGEAPPPRRAEVVQLLELGARFVPEVVSWRPLRAFCGVRPLVADPDVVGPRGLSRSHVVVDHAEREGLVGLVSVLGGKWTTYRLMGEQVGDVVAARLGVEAPTRTRSLLVVPPRARSRPATSSEVLCQCEGVDRDALVAPDPYDVWRQDAWVAMGPCQGTFCAHRLAARRAQLRQAAVEEEPLAALREERGRGLDAASLGAQAQLAMVAAELRSWWGWRQ